MKIRTDFVTNSSSSSFVAYNVYGDLLKSLMEKFGFDFKCDAMISSSYDEEDETLSMSYFNEAGNNVKSTLAELMIYALTKSQDMSPFYGENDIKELNELEEWNFDKLKDLPKTKFEEYQFKNKYDGSVQSIIKIIYELFANTDFESRIDVETTYTYGGGECDISDKFCGFGSSGESTTTNYEGKLTEYAVHPYDGGFGFIDNPDRYYISYKKKELIIRDVRSDFDPVWDISFTNEDIDQVINGLIKCGNGLKGIEEISCKNITEINVPSSVLYISDNAFEKCTSLEKVTINRINTSIEENSIPKGVVIAGLKGSSAEIFAKENGYRFQEIPCTESNGKYYDFDDEFKIYCPVDAEYTEETLNRYASVCKINLPTEYPGSTLDIVFYKTENADSDTFNEAVIDGLGCDLQFIGKRGGYEYYFCLEAFEHIMFGLYNVNYKVIIYENHGNMYELNTQYVITLENAFDDIDKTIPYLKTFCNYAIKCTVGDEEFTETDGLSTEKYIKDINDLGKLSSKEDIEKEKDNFKNEIFSALMNAFGLSTEDEDDDNE